MPFRILTTLTAGVLIALVAGAVPLASAQPVPVQPQLPSGVSVVGEGVVLAQPNVARITLGADVSDASLSNAQAEAARRMDAVINKLKAAGIPDSDIRTTAYNVNPQYDQRDQSQPPLLRGYTVQNLVEVKTTNVGGLGALLDDVVGSGATRISGISFESDNIEVLKNQARDQAMANARAKADQLARDAGVSLGKPVSIEESDIGGVTPVRAFAAAPQAAQAPSTPIQAGQLSVSTTVRVVWSIQ